MSTEADYKRLISGELRGLLPAAARACLRPLSWVYRAAVSVRNRAYELGLLPCYQAGVPVISVGNITAGGTGKTPMVEYLCRRLCTAGWRPAIVSRGYGARAGPNDEALLLAANLPAVPHVQEPDRVAGAREAIERHGCDIIVLDDGFQHRRLRRDLDLVLIDCTNPFGYGYLLPRGLLREPLAGLRRADAIVLTRAECLPPADLDQLRRQLERLAGNKPLLTASHRPRQLWRTDGSTEPLRRLGGQCRRFLWYRQSCGVPAYAPAARCYRRRDANLSRPSPLQRSGPAVAADLGRFVERGPGADHAKGPCQAAGP